MNEKPEVGVVEGVWARRAVLGAMGAAALAVVPAREAAAVQLGSVQVGGRPGAVAVNSVTGMVYVACGDGSVALVDGRAEAVRATRRVGSTTNDVAVSEVTGRVYVSNSLAGTVTALDGASGRVVSTIAAGPGASALGVDATADTVYAGSRTTGMVSVIDAVSGAVRRVLPGEHGPLAGASVDPGRRLAYFTVPGLPGVAALDLAEQAFADTIRLGDAPEGVAVHGPSGTVYVANAGIHHLSVIDSATHTERARVLLRSAASSVAVREADATVYANGGPDGLVRIDGLRDRITGELSLGINPGSVAVDQRAGKVYVTDPVHDALLLISGF